MTDKKKNNTIQQKDAKSVSISLPEPYLGYVKKAKLVKGWGASELIRRALDAFMTENPLEDK